ncbi:UNC93-like protein [Colletotrichum sp. SAR 10_99]|nr:UNC93-like protein [Colletotrichum sp. SAR 10_99]
MISYPEDQKRGRYLAYWLAYRNGGSIVGGAINLAFNGRKICKAEKIPTTAELKAIAKILVRKDFLLV